MAVERIAALRGAFIVIVDAGVGIAQVGADDRDAAHLVTVVVAIAHDNADFGGPRKQRVARVGGLRVDGSAARHRRPCCNGRVKAAVAGGRDEGAREAGVGRGSAKGRILREVARLRVAIESTRAVDIKGRRFEDRRGWDGRLDHRRQRTEPVQLRAVVAVDELEAAIDVDVPGRDAHAQIADELDVDLRRRRRIVRVQDRNRFRTGADDLIFMKDPQSNRACRERKLHHDLPHRRLGVRIHSEVAIEVDGIVERCKAAFRTSDPIAHEVDQLNDLFGRRAWIRNQKVDLGLRRAGTFVGSTTRNDEHEARQDNHPNDGFRIHHITKGGRAGPSTSHKGAANLTCTRVQDQSLTKPSRALCAFCKKGHTPCDKLRQSDLVARISHFRSCALHPHFAH